MKFSYHESCRGKPAKVPLSDGRYQFWCDGKKISLGYDWINTEASFDDVFELLTVDGIAIAPYLKANPRNMNNFLEQSLVLIDIDSGMTLDALQQHPFYKEFGAGFYTTPSHTEADHRFRVLHRLEVPETSPERMRALYRALMEAYGNADASCKDSSRLFFGTINAVKKEKRDNVLPTGAAESLIEYIQAKDEEKAKSLTVRDYKPLDDESKRVVIDLLKQSYVGDYTTWRAIGWGLKTGGFTLSDFQYVTDGLMREKTPAAAKTVWDDGNGQITMGTVIHFLRQRYGNDVLAAPRAGGIELIKKERIKAMKMIRKGAY